ncbi:hypothetical protein D3C80_1054240 [compost metagenome]
MTVFLDDIGWRNQRHRPGGSGCPQTCADLTFSIGFEQIAVHVAGAAAHHVTGHNVLRDSRFHKACRGIHFNFAGFHIGFIHDATHAAVVVNVAMGINNRDDRFIATVFKIEIHPNFGRFSGDQRVDDGNTFFPLDNSHIRQINVTNLIYAISHFK